MNPVVKFYHRSFEVGHVLLLNTDNVQTFNKLISYFLQSKIYCIPTASELKQIFLLCFVLVLTVLNYYNRDN